MSAYSFDRERDEARAATEHLYDEPRPSRQEIADEEAEMRRERGES